MDRPTDGAIGEYLFRHQSSPPVCVDDGHPLAETTAVL
jgi:hypothetical protein